jgi:integrase
VINGSSPVGSTLPNGGDFLSQRNSFRRPERLFCQMLASSGARISEVLGLTPASIGIESGAASLITLRRRKRGVVRQVPLPRDTLRDLNRFFKLRRLQRDPDLAVKRLWRWSCTTAWRRVKEVMAAAKIVGTPAMPKGLRHGFGVSAFQASVPPHLVQRWLGQRHTRHRQQRPHRARQRRDEFQAYRPGPRGARYALVAGGKS